MPNATIAVKHDIAFDYDFIRTYEDAFLRMGQLFDTAHDIYGADDLNCARQICITAADEGRLLMREYQNSEEFRTTADAAALRAEGGGRFEEPSAPIIESLRVRRAIDFCAAILMPCEAIPQNLRESICSRLDELKMEPAAARELQGLFAACVGLLKASKTKKVR